MTTHVHNPPKAQPLQAQAYDGAAVFERIRDVVLALCEVPCKLDPTHAQRLYVAEALGYVAHQVSPAIFSEVYDRLCSVVQDPRGAGTYRDIVVAFLTANEKGRLKILAATAEYSDGLSELQVSSQVAETLAAHPFKPEHADALSETAVKLLKRRATLGDRDVTDLTIAKFPAPPPKIIVTPPMPTTLSFKGVDTHVQGARTLTERFTPGIKETHRVLSGDTLQAEPPDVLFRRIYAAAGKSGVYTMSETLVKGSFGKFRIAVDQSGKAWGIKEFRLADKGQGVPLKTNVSSENSVANEFDVMARAKSQLGAHEVFAVDDKVYAVLPLKAGDFEQIMSVVQNQPVLYPVVMRRLFKDVAADLARCHEANVIHRDIKFENVVWDADGTFALADYGMVFEGLQCDVADFAGTEGYFAPEIILGTPYLDAYDKRVDIFSLGLVMAYSHANANNCPFYVNSMKDMKVSATLFQAWRNARSIEVGSPLEIDWDAVYAGSHPLDTFAREFHQADSELCEFVFEKMLRINPDDRASAADCARRADELFAQDDDLHQPLQQLMAYLADSDADRNATIAALKRHNKEALDYFVAQAAHVPLPAPGDDGSL